MFERTPHRSQLLRDTRSHVKRVAQDLQLIRGYDRSTEWIEVGSGSGAPAFQNSWVNHSAGVYSVAAFMRSSSGIVYVKGLIKTGTMVAIAFTLPEGFRPLERRLFGTVSNAAIGYVEVFPNGEVWPIIGTNVWIALESIIFPAEQ